MTTLDTLGEDGILARILPLLSATGPVRGAGETGGGGVGAGGTRTGEIGAGASGLRGIGAGEIGPGDDAAVLRHASDRIVLTTDTMVEPYDVRWDLSSGADAGFKIVVQNLADVAAMGARPEAVLLSLSAPPETDIGLVEDIARGVGEACTRYGARIAGGDLGRARTVTLTVTATGALPVGASASVRSGARPGDVLAVAGDVIGRSGAGLDLLLGGCADADPAAVAVHRRPAPELAAGPRAREAGVHALLDISDGLMRDAGRIARASDVTIDLAAAVVAGDAATLGAAGDALGTDPLRWVLFGGEEHQLLGAFAPDRPLPDGFRVVGAVGEPRSDDARVTLGGRPVSGRGFDHFGG